MWHLVKKDILLCRIGIFFIVLMNFLFGFVNVILTSPYSTITLGYNLFMGLYLTIAIALEREKKVEGDMILHSIPLDKEVIVQSKYISSLLFPLTHGVVFFIYSHILKYTRVIWVLGFRLTGGGPIHAISIYSLLTVLAVVILFLAIFLALYYGRLGKTKALNVIAYFIFIILPAIIIRFSDKIMALDIVKYFSSLDKEMLALISFVTSLFLYWVSMEISKRLYSR